MVNVHCVVELVLDLNLGPALLFGFSRLASLSWESSFLVALAAFGIFALILLFGLKNFKTPEKYENPTISKSVFLEYLILMINRATLTL